MDDLWNNFSLHINNKISHQLYIALNKTIKESKGLMYDEIVRNIKETIRSFMGSIIDDKDYEIIAEKLYWGYVEMDDKNLMKAIKLFIRYYSFYHQLEFKQVFYKWRIISLSPSVIKAVSIVNNKTIKEDKKKEIKYMTKKDDTVTKDIHNVYIKNDKNEHLDNKNIYHYPLSQNVKYTNASIYTKLHADNQNREYNKTFTEELQDVTKVSQCTFIPYSTFSI